MKIFRFLKSGGFITLAVAIFIFRAFFVDNLRWFIGGLMVLYGILGIICVILEKKRPIYNGYGFLFSSIEILVGSTILIFVREYSTVCVLWAAWSIFRESVEIKEIADGELHPALAVVSGVESVAVMILSVMLIVEPGRHHAMIHTYLLLAELILAGLIPVLNHDVIKRHGSERKEKPEIDGLEPTEQAEISEESEEAGFSAISANNGSS